MTFLIFAMGPLLLLQVVADHFSYSGKHGPSHWGDKHKACLGKVQSPIDIEDKYVKLYIFPRLQFSNVRNPHTISMTNNGHTVMIEPTDSELPMVSGGPLNDTYIFQQLHFHWGETDDVGSENLINHRAFSMELHAVFYKKSYGSFNEATNHPDGLTVLGHLFEATDEPNPTFTSIVSQMQEVTAVGNKVTINDANVLNKLIAPNIASMQDYFAYIGSLTTPPCLEIVRWIVFVKPQHISRAQLATFRSILSSDGTNLTYNFRPVQPLGNRIIFRNNIKAMAAKSKTTIITLFGGKTTIHSSNAPQNTNTISQYSGQERGWPTSYSYLFYLVLHVLSSLIQSSE